MKGILNFSPESERLASFMAFDSAGKIASSS